MQQEWEYGYLYVVGMSVQEEAQRWPTVSDRKVAIVEDAQGRHVLSGANSVIDALNALGCAGWIISDGRQGTGNAMPEWLRTLATESSPSTLADLTYETTHFMRRPSN